MSYIRMTVYSFTCDAHPDNTTSGEYESLPPFRGGLRAAERELRAAGWATVSGRHFCPDHHPDSKQEG